jgi:hypothetical protein
MKPMIAYCGLVCSECPTYLATQNDDDMARVKTAAFLSEKYGLNFKAEDINCDGCLSSGERLIGYCNTCDVRKCAIAKSVENCSVCNVRPCEKLNKFHEFSPDAKASFESTVGKST